MERSYPVDKNDRNSSNSMRSARSGVVPERKLTKQAGSLEFIEDNVSREPKKSTRPPSQSSQSSERSWSRSSFGSVPPRCDSSLSKRSATPTKQVSLQAVRRKEESNADLFVDHVDWKDLDSGRNSRNDGNDSEDLSETFRKMRLAHLQREATDMSDEGGAAGGAPRLSAKEMKEEEKEEDEKEVESDEDDSESDDEDSEPRKAPTELLMEFVDCLMKKDYQNADKLCKMILIYEPENPEALNFKPLIEEKIQLDAEAALESSDDDEDDDEDDSDDDSDDSDDSDESSDDEEDDDNKKTDSALASSSQPSTSSQPSGQPSSNQYSDQQWATTLRYS